jgi:hypothetical protein
VVGDQIAATITAKTFTDIETADLSQFGSTTSSQLASVISDETGSGVLVFGTSPGFTTAANPASSDGAALGTTSLQWSDLFLASGAVLNFSNGDVVATHSTGILTVGTGDLRVTTAGANTASVVTVGGTQTLTNKTLSSATVDLPTFTNWGGWITDTKTWTYGSNTTYANTFTISSGIDWTTIFSKGTRIKLTQTTVKYFVVMASSFASSTTTVTINGGDDYTLTNAAISATAYSYELNPQGYPTWFNWTPTYSGWSSNPTNVVHRWSCPGGNSMMVAIRQSGGTSNSTAHTLTLPVVAATITNANWTGIGAFVDNGATGAGRGSISSASTTMSCQGIISSGSNTSSGSSFVASVEVIYEF